MSLNLENAIQNEWHVLKGETKYGPYTYQEMISMLQNKMLFEFDYVWSPHLETWTTLRDLPDFSHDRITRLVEKAQKEQTQDVFHARAHERVQLNLSVLCHDNARLWPGRCENLSQGGALVFMENPLLLPGHLINLHFRKEQDADLPFNTVAEILTKRLTKKKIEHDTGIYYVVKFMQILSQGEGQIQKYVARHGRKNENKENKTA